MSKRFCYVAAQPSIRADSQRRGCPLQRIRAQALVCFLALIVHRVMRMWLRQAKRAESPMGLLEQLSRIQLQTIQGPAGQLAHGLTELKGEQKDLFAAIGATPPKASHMHAPAHLIAEYANQM